jgi:hypothetical protein
MDGDLTECHPGLAYCVRDAGVADAIAALYAKDAFWQQHPFWEPEPGLPRPRVRGGGVGQVPVRHADRRRRSGCCALERADQATDPYQLVVCANSDQVNAGKHSGP